MKIAIVTVNYNGKKDTLELLESLKKFQIVPKGTASRRTNFKFQIRTIVVDNGSSDGSVSAIHKKFPKVDVLQVGTNLGFSGGYNKGINYAQIWGADFFFLINNDCLIKDSDLLEKLIKVAESDIKIGLVSPKILFASGFEFHKDRYKDSDKGKVVWYAGGRFDWDNIASIHRGLDEVDHGQYDEVSETELVSGACVLIKKEVIDMIGGFDERFFLYFEDSDFQKRAMEAGFKKYYHGKTAIYHKVSQSTGIGSLMTDYYHSRNRLIFGMKYGKFRTKFALLREAIMLLLLGRPAQRRGILDFYLGITGGVYSVHPKGVSASHLGIEYPYKLSIVIVNYNTANLTKKLLQSIFRPTPGVGYVETSGFDQRVMEVIVLDNGQEDPCKSWIDQFPVQYLQNEENEGFSKGYNKTIKFAKGEYILMLNSDTEVLENSLSEMVKKADEYKGEGVLGGRLVFPDGSAQDSVFRLPTIAGAFKEYFLAQIGSYFMYQPKGDQPAKVEGLVMACFLIPQKVINKVGLLDEGTFIFFEDIEYCRRLKNLGIPIYFVPSAKFIHHHGASTKRIGQEKALKLLEKGAKHYHGKLYYFLLSWVLKLGQKLGRVKTPISRWQES